MYITDRQLYREYRYIIFVCQCCLPFVVSLRSDTVRENMKMSEKTAENLRQSKLSSTSLGTLEPTLLATIMLGRSPSSICLYLRHLAAKLIFLVRSFLPERSVSFAACFFSVLGLSQNFTFGIKTSLETYVGETVNGILEKQRRGCRISGMRGYSDETDLKFGC